MKLSVVIAATSDRFPPTLCIESLLCQVRPPSVDLEVIVTPAVAHGESSFAEVTVLPQCPGSSLPLLLESGLRRASGEWIAMTEAHCTFAPDWIASAVAAVARAGRDPAVAAIGGAVEPGDDLRRPIDLALYFTDYIAFASPLVEGSSSSLPGSNVMFRREALQRQGDLPPGFWKTFHCLELEKKGKKLVLDTSMVVYYHRKIAAVDLVDRRLTHGRCFGAMRAAHSTLGRRFLYAAAGPVVPLLLMTRLMREAWPKNRLRRRFVLSLPWSVVCLAGWVAGEWMGNLFGAGTSCGRV